MADDNPVSTEVDSANQEKELIDEQHESEEGMTKTAYIACFSLLLLQVAALTPIILSGVAKVVDDKLGPKPYYNWILISYSVGSAVGSPIAGGLSDIFGRKIFLLAGCGIMTIGWIVGLAATTIDHMIVSILLCGLGASALAILTAAIAEIVPRKSRGIAASVVEVSTVPWAMCGNLVGLTMVKHTSMGFKGILLLGLVLTVVGAVVLVFCYKPPPHELPFGRTKMQELGRLDWIGMFLYAAALTLILVALSLGGVDQPYKSPKYYMPLATGVLALIMLVIWEWKLAKEPFFAHGMFKGPGGKKLPLYFAVIFVSGGTLFSSQALWPQQLQGVYYDDLDKIGIVSMTNGGGVAVGAFFGGVLLGRAWWLDGRYLISFGCLMKVIADIFSSRATPLTPALAEGMGFFGSFFIGAVTIASIASVQILVDEAYLGLASLLLISMRYAGGSVALAVYSNQLQSTLKVKIIGDVLPALQPYMKSIPNLEDFMRKMGTGQYDKARAIPGIDQAAVKLTREKMRWVWAAAFKKVYLVSMGWSIAAVVIALFLASVRPHMTNHVAVHLKDPAPPHTHKHKEDVVEGPNSVREQVA